MLNRNFSQVPHGHHVFKLALVLSAFIAAVTYAEPARYCNGGFVQQNGWDSGPTLYPNGNFVRQNGWPTGAYLYPNGALLRQNAFDSGPLLYPNGNFVLQNGWPTGPRLHPNGQPVRQNGWSSGPLMYPNGNFFRQNGWPSGQCLYSTGVILSPCPTSVKIRSTLPGFGRVTYEMITAGPQEGQLMNFQYEIQQGAVTSFFDVDYASGVIENIDALCD